VGRSLTSLQRRPRPVGIHAIRIEQPKDIRAGTQMAGFALAATKIVLDGGAGQMLEMARANLRNIPGAELLS
jgi:hypothetical protein